VEHNEQVSVQGETTYSLLWVKDYNGCLAKPEDIAGTATIENLKPTTNAGDDFLACGLSSELAAISDKGTGTWTSEHPEVSLSAINDPNSGVNVTEQGTYTLTWTENNNGCENSDQVEIQFKELPSISFEEENAHICQGDEVSFAFTITGNNGPWTLNYSLDEEPQTIDYQDASFSFSASPNQSTTIQMTSLTDQFGCETILTSELSVLVDQMPAPNAGNDKAVCGKEVQLEAQMSPVAQFGEWQVPTGDILNNETSEPKATYQSTDFGSVTLTWLETNGLCTATDEVTIRFDEEPDAYAGEDITLYNQYETILHAGQPVSSTDEWTGEWYISSGPGSIANPGAKDATISGLKHGEVEILWTVTNGACPPASDAIAITVKGLTYHTGISPNGDGVNDSFYIKGAHTIPRNELLIFDQSGKVVFQQNDLEEGNLWDGRDSDGNPLENGIYYFIFRGDGIDPVKDYIVIKRN
jgi:gliding motility-associated-like protein